MRKLIAVIAGLVLLIGQLAAQNRTIKGKVTDEKSIPVANASVFVKSATIGTTTDANGNFSLNVPSTAKILVISSLNFVSQEIEIGTKTNIAVSLVSNTQSLQEVLVVGYGTQKKSTITASVAKVGGDKLENKPQPSLDQMLQGGVSGLQSTASTGQPGANQQIRIRGIGSVAFSSSQPLYVIDGVQINSGDLANGNSNTGGFNINPSTNVLAGINANDIESVTVLKDAAGTSIYGSRGANGVIIITTRKGKIGKTQFRFDAEAGLNKLLPAPDAGKPLRAADWFTLLKEGMVNAGLSQTSINNTLASYGYGSNVDIDWMGLVTRSGTQQQYNLSASGGDSKTKYFLSGGYFNQVGTTIGTDFQRISGNMNITHSVNTKLSLNTKVNVSNIVQHSALASPGNSGGGYFGNPGYVALVLRPTQNPYNADGSLNIGTSNLGFPSHYNPLYIAANDKRWLKGVSLLASQNAEYKILNNLKFTSNIGLQYNTSEEYQYNNPFHGDGSGSSTQGEGISAYTRNFLWDWYNQFDYHIDIIKDKNFYADIKAGYDAIKNTQYQQLGDVISFPPKADLYLSTNGATSTNGKAYSSDYTFTGLYSSANFSYNDIYSVSLSARRDGSSRFGQNNQYGNFYSAGIAWNLTNETFFKLPRVISNLKLRGSYGTSGNAQIGDYTWRQRYSYGYNYNGVSGGTFDNIGNIDLTWEKNKQLDIGIDLSLFKNRISIVADYYRKVSDGLLFNQQISRTTGFSSFINNAAKMENKGFELAVTVRPVEVKDFSWDINFNIAFNKNKILSLPSGDIPNGAYLLREGSDFYAFYTRGWAGVNADDGSPTWYTDSTRSVKTSTYANAKQFLVGKSAIPKYFGGLSNTFTYRNFSITADFYYNYGNYIQEGYARFFLDGTFPTRGKYTINMTRWQQKGDVTDVPKYVYNNATNSGTGSDRLLYKGDYIRLRNLMVSYNLSDKTLLDKLHISALHFYVRGTNLWTKTYDDRLLSDPEQGILGVNNQAVMPSKSMTVGLNVTF